MTYRSKRHTDLAHDTPCFVDHPHDCNDFNGCDPMHPNWLRWGKGVGFKAPDWAVASGCRNAHRLLDDKLGQKLTTEELEAIWIRAFVKTQNYWWENRKLRVA